MAIIKISKAGRTKAALKAALNYICDKNKTVLSETKTLITALNCWGTPQDIYTTMISTKEMYRKDQDDNNSEMYKHFQQSFQPGELDPKTAHQIGIKWADENFAQAGFEICIATHIDRPHIHNHIIINSVNALTGKTLEIHANKTLEQLKTSSDRLCRAYGLSVIQRTNQMNSNTVDQQPIYSMKKRYSILNDNFRQLSWQQQIYDIIKNTLRQAQGKDFNYFEQKLLQNGVAVNYKRLRQDLIFTLLSNEKSISDRILEKTFPPQQADESLLRSNIEKQLGAIPKYKLEKNEILSVRKQGFYELIENLIKVIDYARQNDCLKDKSSFEKYLQQTSWRIRQTETGRAFYNEQAKRYFYDNTIFKITQNSQYCLAQIEQNFDLQI